MRIVLFAFAFVIAVVSSAAAQGLSRADAEGKFRLKTYDGQDVAVPGPHTVILADQDEERPPQGKAPTRLPRLDSKYTTASAGLKAEVPAGGGSVPLDVPGRR